MFHLLSTSVGYLDTDRVQRFENDLSVRNALNVGHGMLPHTNMVFIITPCYRTKWMALLRGNLDRAHSVSFGRFLHQTSHQSFASFRDESTSAAQYGAPGPYFNTFPMRRDPNNGGPSNSIHDSHAHPSPGHSLSVSPPINSETFVTPQPPDPRPSDSEVQREFNKGPEIGVTPAKNTEKTAEAKNTLQSKPHAGDALSEVEIQSLYAPSRQNSKALPKTVSKVKKSLPNSPAKSMDDESLSRDDVSLSRDDASLVTREEPKTPETSAKPSPAKSSTKGKDAVVSKESLNRAAGQDVGLHEESPQQKPKPSQHLQGSSQLSEEQIKGTKQALARIPTPLSRNKQGANTLTKSFAEVVRESPKANDMSVASATTSDRSSSDFRRVLTPVRAIGDQSLLAKSTSSVSPRQVDALEGEPLQGPTQGRRISHDKPKKTAVKVPPTLHTASSSKEESEWMEVPTKRKSMSKSKSTFHPLKNEPLPEPARAIKRVLEPKVTPVLPMESVPTETEPVSEKEPLSVPTEAESVSEHEPESEKEPLSEEPLSDNGSSPSMGILPTKARWNRSSPKEPSMAKEDESTTQKLYNNVHEGAIKTESQGSIRAASPRRTEAGKADRSSTRVPRRYNQSTETMSQVFGRRRTVRDQYRGHATMEIPRTRPPRWFDATGFELPPEVEFPFLSHLDDASQGFESNGSRV